MFKTQKWLYKYLVGSIFLSSIFITYFFSLYKLLSFTKLSNLGKVILNTFNSYTFHVIFFSFYQAFISAILTLVLSIIIAHSFYYQKIIKIRFLIKISALLSTLPSLSIILSLLSIFSSNGWVAILVKHIGINYSWNFYGFIPILIGNIIFNLPLGINIFYNALNEVPENNKKLAKQFCIKNLTYIKNIDLPYIKKSIPSSFVLFFLLCFTSFTSVLILGGSPKDTTLEVLIYENIIFNFNLSSAAILAITQLIISLIFFIFIPKNIFLSQKTQTKNSIFPKFNRSIKIIQSISIALFIITLISILAAIFLPIFQIGNIFNYINLTVIKAFITTLIIGLLSGIINIIMCLFILNISRNLLLNKFNNLGNIINNLGLFIISIPALIISIGLFFILNKFLENYYLILFIISFLNAILTIPYSLNFLKIKFTQNLISNNKLSLSLGVKYLKFFRYVDLPIIKKEILLSFIWSFSLSIGDFTIVSLFGNNNFITLPWLLYQDLNKYQNNAAIFISFIISLTIFFSFIISELFHD
ncbi:MAG: ABC transporter permease subunit [Psittacicella sp.]